MAQTYGRANVGAGDEIIITAMEHHSNIVPWQILCEEKGAHLKVVPISDDGELLLDEYENLLSPRTRFVSVVHQSNALGTINPVEQIVETGPRPGHSGAAGRGAGGGPRAHRRAEDRLRLLCLLGPQAVRSHRRGRPLWKGGTAGCHAALPGRRRDDPVRDLRKDPVQRHTCQVEAGTQNIAGSVGLGAAIDYVNSVGMDNIAAYEKELLAYGTEKLSEIEPVRLIGTARHKGSILSFVMESAHPHDVGTILDAEGDGRPHGPPLRPAA